jgi:hypothetical protein
MPRSQMVMGIGRVSMPLPSAGNCSRESAAPSRSRAAIASLERPTC